jgi:hypothetical protein
MVNTATGAFALFPARGGSVGGGGAMVRNGGLFINTTTGGETVSAQGPIHGTIQLTLHGRISGQFFLNSIPDPTFGS